MSFENFSVHSAARAVKGVPVFYHYGAWLMSLSCHQDKDLTGLPREVFHLSGWIFDPENVNREATWSELGRHAKESGLSQTMLTDYSCPVGPLGPFCWTWSGPHRFPDPDAGCPDLRRSFCARFLLGQAAAIGAPPAVAVDPMIYQGHYPVCGWFL